MGAIVSHTDALTDPVHSATRVWAWILVSAIGLCLAGKPAATDSWARESQGGSPHRIAQAGPAAPNASRVSGELLSLEIVDSSTLQIAPPQTLTRLRIRILSSQAVESEINPLHGQEGQVLEAYSQESVDPQLIGRMVTCIVKLNADERGGQYWAYDIKGLPRE